VSEVAKAHVIEGDGRRERDSKTGLNEAFVRAGLEPSGAHIFHIPL
jgi:hypothetical protein